MPSRGGYPAWLAVAVACQVAAFVVLMAMVFLGTAALAGSRTSGADWAEMFAFLLVLPLACTAGAVAVGRRWIRRDRRGGGIALTLLPAAALAALLLFALSQ